MSNLQALASRARGIYLGAAVGDALGWPQEQNSNIVGGNRNRNIDPRAEFRSWERYAGGQYQKYTDLVPAGGYSDDTQLILATSRALQSEDWLTALTRCELPLFLLYSRGAGGATLRACRTWASGAEPWITGNTQSSRKSVASYFQAGGNGVAMRIAPYVVLHATRPVEELVARVVLDGITTHGHPRALVGAASYAVALHALLNHEGTLEFGELPALVEHEKSWQRVETLLSALPSEWLNAAAAQFRDFIGVWDQTVNEMRDMLTVADSATRLGTRGDDMGTLEQLGTFDRKLNGAGTVTAAAAIYLASRNAPRPMSGLLRAAFLKNADTDTLASMTGALLGALHGPDWLADMGREVQDRAYIEHMADDMTARTLGEERPALPVPDLVTDGSMRRFKDTLVVGKSGPVVLPDGRPAKIARDRPLEVSGKNRAHRWILDANGQTFIIDQTAKLTDSERKARAFRDTDAQAAERPQKPTAERARFVRLTLRADALDPVESFYKTAMGLQVERVGPGEIIVDGLVRFVENKNHVFGSSMVLLTFEVEDVPLVSRNLGHGSRGPGDSFRSQDPAGHDLDIRPRRTTSTSRG